MPKRKDPKIELRKREAEWILFLDNGYYLFTKCSACGNMRNCRGRYRESVKCHDCHSGYTEKQRIEILEEAVA